MDADISAAATALDLDKIKAQDYRDALRRGAEDRAAFRAQVQSLLDWLRAEYVALPSADAELRRELAVSIAPKYFTTSTAILPESVLADAQRDAARFKAALDEAMKAVV